MGALSHELKTAEEWWEEGKKKDDDKQQSNYSEKYLVFGPWGPLQGPVLFNIFINEWEDGNSNNKKSSYSHMETGTNSNENRTFFFRRKRILGPDFTWTTTFGKENLDRNLEILIYLMRKRQPCGPSRKQVETIFGNDPSVRTGVSHHRQGDRNLYMTL